MKKYAKFIVLSTLISGCGNPPERPFDIVFVVDLTGSVAKESRAASIEAVQKTLGRFKRGDSLAIIPITADAQMDSPRHVLRFRLRENRDPYDADLRRLAREAEVRFAELLDVAIDKPYMYSDVLGVFQLAAEEFSHGNKDADRVLVCLSDFIHDDLQYDFKRDHRVSTDLRARAFAETLAGINGDRFRDVRIYLGLVYSTDLKRLSRSRRNAIRVFWLEYLSRQGADVIWATDGKGQVGRFLGGLERNTWRREGDGLQSLRKHYQNLIKQIG
jgi:hypothetical protein